MTRCKNVKLLNKLYLNDVYKLMDKTSIIYYNIRPPLLKLFLKKQKAFI